MTGATTFDLRRNPYPAADGARHLPRGGRVISAQRLSRRNDELDAFRQTSDRIFVHMMCEYSASGGIAGDAEVIERLASTGAGGFVTLARWIAERRLSTFRWCDTFWMPRFQLDLDNMTVRPEVRLVVKELAETFDGWTIARWFVEPHVLLSGSRPLDFIFSDSLAVLDAATVDRCCATK